jgi:hypothetical protein
MITSVFIIKKKGPGGEIGKHTILRGWRPNGFMGSSPVLGTKIIRRKK